MKLPISVAIPTYNREKTLLDTIKQIFDQIPAPAEIIIIDQTQKYATETEDYINHLEESGQIRRILMHPPSQPRALNLALIESKQPIVLFLDDDIRIEQGLIKTHVRSYNEDQVWAVAGQVLQPDQRELTNWNHIQSNSQFADFDFPFNHNKRTQIQNGMSGNLSVRRHKAIEIGGFDENFIPPVSYRFDNEFCKRLCKKGGKIIFEPTARIYHLRCESGGTRTHGSHLTSISPIHSVGDYYFAFRQGINSETFKYILKRPFREISTKFHLKKPWWIPVKLLGEIRALLLALKLYKQGPKLIQWPKDRFQKTEDSTHKREK